MDHTICRLFPYLKFKIDCDTIYLIDLLLLNLRVGYIIISFTDSFTILSSRTLHGPHYLQPSLCFCVLNDINRSFQGCHGLVTEIVKDNWTIKYVVEFLEIMKSQSFVLLFKLYFHSMDHKCYYHYPDYLIVSAPVLVLMGIRS